MGPCSVSLKKYVTIPSSLLSSIIITYSEIKSLTELVKKKIRVGGMVKEQSVFITSKEINFIITDFKNEIYVVYSGAVPNLFAEGKGVVAEGFLKDKNYFIATKILAKHDENYMPPEVKEAIGDN